MSIVMEDAAKRLSDEASYGTYEMICGIAMGVARATSNPVEEITVLRIAGSRLAVSGRRQRARDFAEAALQLGRKSELHARYAWVDRQSACRERVCQYV